MLRRRSDAIFYRAQSRRSVMSSTRVSRAHFIDAMRNVASSVTVVTTDGDVGRFGATVSAFSSLSADPPSVLICIKADSRIAWAVERNGMYCVNVLPETAVDLANRFAGRFDNGGADRFDGVALDTRNQSMPVLKGATAFLCRVQNATEYGSHKIIIGHVDHVTISDMPPLTYLGGAYHWVRPQYDFLQENFV